MTAKSENEAEVEKTSEDGMALPRRIRSSAQAYTLYRKLKEDNLQTAAWNAKLVSLYDGRPPYNQQERERRGLGWMANFNSREAEANVEAKADDSFKALFGELTMIRLFPRITKAGEDRRQLAAWGSIISEEYTDTIRLCEDFSYHANLRLLDVQKFGAGFCIWPDPWDWRSEHVDNSNVLLPKKSRGLVSRLKEFCVRDEIDPLDLLAKIELETAAEIGWDVAYCRRVLGHFTKNKSEDGESYQKSPWESVRERIRNQDFTAKASGIRIVHVFVMESAGGRPGSVSHYILSETEVLERRDGGKDSRPTPFMFSKENRFEDMGQILSALTYHVGNGRFSGVKGQLHRTYALTDISNRLLCGVVNGAALSSSMVLKTVSGVSGEEAPAMHIGAFTLIPENYEHVQQTFAPPIDRILGARTVLQQLQNNNVGLYRNRTESSVPGSQYRTVGEAEIEQRNEANRDAGRMEWLYNGIWPWHRETLRRLFSKNYPESAGGYEERKDFIDRCKARGVPDELMDDSKWYIIPVRSLGMGSDAAMRSTTNELVRSLPLWDAEGQSYVKRRWLSGRVHWTEVDSIVAPFNRQDVPTIHSNMAEGENVDMASGSPRTAASDDEHWIHVPSHVKFAASMIDSFMKEPSIQKASCVELEIAHIGAHLKFAASDPNMKKDVAEYVAVLQKLISQLGEMKRVVQDMQNQQAAAQEEQQKKMAQAEEILRNKDVEIGKYKADREAEVSRYRIDKVEVMETELMHQVRELKALLAAQTKTDQAAAAIAREDVKAQHEINAGAKR